MHIPVLLHECLEGMNLRPGTTVVDGTINGGGHSAAIAEKYGAQITIIGIDMDADALERSRVRLARFATPVILVCNSFKNISSIVQQHAPGKVHAVLLDLGLSSDQFEMSGRGFSFQKDEPLLMTFKKDPTTNDVTAADIVNTWEESSIATIISGFGEERYAHRIARAIVEHRQHERIERTGQLVDIITRVMPSSSRRYKIHPATRTFQALRIAVNGELSLLPEALAGARSVLVPGGRLCVISFHSLEDRIVKQYFKQCAEEGDIVITKKPIVPSDDEIIRNPRSRSSKLRILETYT